jgi:membrane fusion protein (multidrug efflux system)
MPRFFPRFSFLIIPALLGVVPGCRKNEQAGSNGATSAAFVVDVMPVTARPFRETLSATGSLVARETVQLQSERSGIVRDIRFEEGQPAKVGEILVVIDDSELRAQLDRAQATLKLGEVTHARQQTLLESRGISQAEFEQSQANLEIGKAEVALIESQLAKTRIRAPFDGVAGLRRVSVGTYLTPGTVICSFQDIHALKIDFTLPERYYGYLKLGQKITFRIAGRAEKFEATIAAIEPSVDVQTRSLLVRAEVPNDEQRLLAGSFAEVEVTLDEIKDAILIPSIALIPGLKQQTVFVYRDGHAEERKVQPGLRTADAVQIIEGLAPGDQLITSGVLQLRPGMKVEVKPRTAQPASAAKPAVNTAAAE